MELDRKKSPVSTKELREEKEQAKNTRNTSKKHTVKGSPNPNNVPSSKEELKSEHSEGLHINLDSNWMSPIVTSTSKYSPSNNQLKCINLNYVANNPSKFKQTPQTGRKDASD